MNVIFLQVFKVFLLNIKKSAPDFTKRCFEKKGPEKNQKYTDNKKKQAQSMKKKTNTKQVSGICFQDRSEV